MIKVKRTGTLRSCAEIGAAPMASGSVDEEMNKGSMWELDQNLDQPMDEEAGRLRNMYREKV